MIGKALDIFETVLDRVIPDSNARKAAKEQLAQLEQAGDLQLLMAQLRVNETEAASSSLFVAGWRPAVGWICAAGLGWNFIAAPMLQFIAVIAMAEPPAFPQLEIMELMTILGGMLGLSRYRSIEKMKGVARER